MNLIATYKITWLVLLLLLFVWNLWKIEAVWLLYVFGFTVFFWSFGWAVRWPENCVCLIISLKAKAIQICCEKAPPPTVLHCACWFNHFFIVPTTAHLIHFNPLNPELNLICYLLALLLAHHFLHVSRIRVKSLTFRQLMFYIYIYGAPILDVSRSGRSHAEILGSNPTGGMDICLLWVSCVVR